MYFLQSGKEAVCYHCAEPFFYETIQDNYCTCCKAQSRDNAPLEVSCTVPSSFSFVVTSGNNTIAFAKTQNPIYVRQDQGVTVNGLFGPRSFFNIGFSIHDAKRLDVEPLCDPSTPCVASICAAGIIIASTKPFTLKSSFPTLKGRTLRFKTTEPITL